MVITQAALRAAQTGYNFELRKSLDDALKNADDVANLLLSDSSAPGVESMVHHMLGGVPVLEEMVPGGPAATSNITINTATVENLIFQRLIALRRENLERRGAAVYMSDIKKMGGAVAQWRSQRLATQLIEGFTTVKDYTNTTFFATGKKLADGSKVTLTNKTTGKLNEARFNTAVENMLSRTDAAGNILGLGKQGNLHLVVSPANRSTGTALVVNSKKAGGADNENYGAAKLHVWPWLAAMPDAWFLFDTSFTKPATHQVEVPFSNYMQTNPEDSGVMKSGEFLYQIYHRGNIKLVDPLGSYGSDGTVA